MMRSLYSGISGLRNHQTRMDVIGNNIANVNTAGYKTSRVIFQDIFSQNVSAGMANQGEIGGTNPTQVGLGIRLSTVDVIHSRAAFQRTDRETDMMINGDGFFIVAQVNPDTGEFEQFYTRAGNFDIDNDGYLTTSSGLYVLGSTYELVMGVVDAGSEGISRRPAINRGAYGPDVEFPDYENGGGFRPGDVIPAGLFSTEPTNVPEGQITITIDNMHEWNSQLPATFTQDWPATNRPLFTAVAPRDPIFGLVQGPSIPGLSQIRVTAERTILPDPDPATGLPYGAPPREVGESNNDYRERLEAWLEGVVANSPSEEVGLPGFSVADNGDISVIMGNRKIVIGRIAIGVFSNASGLEKAGNSLYLESASSGPVTVTEAFLDGAGKIDGGGLEMSNVDLANEFTDMIVTQRGFQANSRIITVSDTMLEELVNLKR